MTGSSFASRNGSVKSPSNSKTIPEECWHALEALASVEPETRLSIIDELSLHVDTARRCNTCSGSCRRHATRGPRAAARAALPRAEAAACGIPIPRTRRRSDLWSEPAIPPMTLTRARDVDAVTQIMPGRLPNERGLRLLRCLVTPVDGRGRGSIVISVNQMGQRGTAAFLCDVQRGIRDVVGEVEPESPAARAFAR